MEEVWVVGVEEIRGEEKRCCYGSIGEFGGE